MKTISIEDKIIVLECLESGNEICCECSHYQTCHLVRHDSRGIIITVLVSITLIVYAALVWG